MDYLHSDHVANIGVEVRHDPFNIEAEVENPCFFDERVSEDVMQSDRVDIGTPSEVTNRCKLPR